MIIIDVPQRSTEWFAARVGCLTASRAADMLATIKSGEAAARRDLRTQLVVERLTGRSDEAGYVNAAMQRGIDCEPAAFAAYETLTGRVAQRVGFCRHETVLAGCSPDGLVGYDTVLELKCPKSSTHLRYLEEGRVPLEYVPQLTHALWVTGLEHADFLSFDDRFPSHMQTFLVRVGRSDLDIEGYAAKALAFLAEVDTDVEQWKGHTNG